LIISLPGMPSRKSPLKILNIKKEYTMQKTSYTPGLWSVNNNIGRKGEMGIVADNAPCIIAIMGNQKKWPVEAEANARLIAAAPEMLEVISVVIGAIEKGTPANRTTLTAIFDILSPVLKKALGE
jgi:hypothetical protein